jgi:hypothetical protein
VYHNFTSSKNKALQGRCQIVHLEGAVAGAFWGVYFTLEVSLWKFSKQWFFLAIMGHLNSLTQFGTKATGGSLQLGYNITPQDIASQAE